MRITKLKYVLAALRRVARLCHTPEDVLAAAMLPAVAVRRGSAPQSQSAPLRRPGEPGATGR